MSTKPISPDEAAKIQQSLIPDEIIESFNELIAENYKSTSKESVVLQKDVLSRIHKKMPNISGGVIFKNNWLNIENLYSNEGWIVQYDRPAYCESYEPYFKFTRRK
jgi:hypothetical protein